MLIAKAPRRLRRAPEKVLQTRILFQRKTIRFFGVKNRFFSPLDPKNG
jgi:hypothetical protein